MTNFDDQDTLVPTTNCVTEYSTIIQETSTISEDLTTVQDEAEDQPTSKYTTESLTVTEVESTTLLPITTVTEVPDAEERHISRGQEEPTSANRVEDDLTTLVILSTTIPENQNVTNSHNKLLSSEIEILLNKSKIVNKEQEYEDYYDHPTLPPSLPNLR